MGFMPTVGADGNASLGLCPAYSAAAPAGLEHYAGALTRHDHGAHHHGGPTDHYATCAFAASANAAPAATHSLLLIAVGTARLIPYVDSQLAAPLGSVPRAQSPRAPPALI